MKERESSTRRRSSRLVWGFALMVAFAVGLLSITGCREGGEEQATDSGLDGEGGGETEESGTEEDSEGEVTIPVEVATVERGPIASYIEATANLVAEKDVRVLAEAEAMVLELLVDEGDRIEEGQAIARLARDDAEIALSKARARAANAELAYRRAESMRSQDLISREAYDTSTMDHALAGEEVAEAEWRLGKRTVSAPFSGWVTERFVNPGQRVRPGDALFSVADLNPLVARIYLTEQAVLGLQEEREVRITLNADDRIEFLGQVRQVSPVVDVATGTVKVTLEAFDVPREVRPGGFVTIRIVLEEHDNVVLVPLGALIPSLGRVDAFVVDGDRATKQEVAVGMTEGELVEILSGVEAGDRLITAGHGRLKEGSKISILSPDDSGEEG